jgi:hypothetical protein
MATLVSLIEIDRFTPIKDADRPEVLNECDRHGIDYDAKVWTLDDIAVTDVPGDSIGSDGGPFTPQVIDDLRATHRAGLSSLVPPIIVLHAPGYAQGSDTGAYMLWDGAHRRAVALDLGQATIRAWVAHHDRCCPHSPT